MTSSRPAAATVAGSAALAAVLALLLASTARCAQDPAARARPPDDDRLLVCNRADRSLSVFDVAGRREVARLPIGGAPQEVAVAPDGRRAVVAARGDRAAARHLTVVDVTAARVLRRIDLGEGADAGALAFAGAGQLVVTCPDARRVLLVDVTRGAVARAWSTPQQRARLVAVDGAGRRAVVTSAADGLLATFELDRDGAEAARTTALGAGCHGVAIRPGTGAAWVSNRREGTVAVVAPDGARSATLEVGAMPVRVAFTPDGDVALVACADSGELVIVAAEQRRVLHAVALHGDASEQGYDPVAVVSGADGRFAYVACARGELIAVVDVAAGAVVDRLAARAGPAGVAYARPIRR